MANDMIPWAFSVRVSTLVSRQSKVKSRRTGGFVARTLCDGGHTSMKICVAQKITVINTMNEIHVAYTGLV